MDYNDNPRIGLLQKNKVSDVEYINNNDIELISVDKDNSNNYMSLEDSNKQVRFQAKQQQPVKPNDYNPEILFSQISSGDSNNIKSVSKPEQPKPQQQEKLLQSQRQQQQQAQQPQILQSQQQQQQSQYLQQQNKQQAKIVTCPICKCQQAINDPEKPFQCFQCRLVIQVTFQLFLCGTCQSRVMYQVGISPLIRCTKCGTNNYVQQPMFQNGFQNQMQSQWGRIQQINQQQMMFSQQNPQMMQSSFNTPIMMQSQVQQQNLQQQPNPDKKLNQQNQQIIDQLLEPAKPKSEEEEKQFVPLPPVNPWAQQQPQINQANRPPPQQQPQITEVVLQNEPTEYIQMLSNKRQIQVPQDQL